MAQLRLGNVKVSLNSLSLQRLAADDARDLARCPFGLFDRACLVCHLASAAAKLARCFANLQAGELFAIRVLREGATCQFREVSRFALLLRSLARPAPLLLQGTGRLFQALPSCFLSGGLPPAVGTSARDGSNCGAAPGGGVAPEALEAHGALLRPSACAKRLSGRPAIRTAGRESGGKCSSERTATD